MNESRAGAACQTSRNGVPCDRPAEIVLTFVTRQAIQEDVLLCPDCPRDTVPYALEQQQPPYIEAFFLRINGAVWQEWDDEYAAFSRARNARLD